MASGCVLWSCTPRRAFPAPPLVGARNSVGGEIVGDDPTGIIGEGAMTDTPGGRGSTGLTRGPPPPHPGGGLALSTPPSCASAAMPMPMPIPPRSGTPIAPTSQLEAKGRVGRAS
eukprot:CAMPEP_0175902382 /NCGR_PEP_ID=MMETSP0108-20121206/3363_1 /TAXON_ID=195067 ORGANISM="Goniomonas pacifica, Strain CCMP1869" /NCGR_SAMPLE_ID=MMETSP0108 /ASSEMBLY_ACC=CAM_ASM_000204 /LENGTH=114 /DNA_ID=CAMNT_0017224023 /DNA_START=90 /DNA_END=431 /DNA_ORIENTATION=-